MNNELTTVNQMRTSSFYNKRMSNDYSTNKENQ